MADWTAYCAPGQSAIAALVLLMAGEDVSEVNESPVLDGSAIILVSQEVIEHAFDIDMPLERSPPAGMLSRSPYDPLRMLLDDLARESLRQPLVLTQTGV